MNLILITTLPNSVYDELMKVKYLSIDILDCNESAASKTQFLAVLEQMIAAKEYQLLITYRCPYIIPSYIRDKIDECLNIHPLSLPEFGGLNPWERFFQTGKRSSEAIVHIMDDRPDSGEIIARWSYSFNSSNDARAVSDKVIAENLIPYLTPANPNSWFKRIRSQKLSVLDISNVLR